MRRIIGSAALAVLAVAATFAISALTPAAAQDEPTGSEIELRVVARPLEDGQIEFGIEQRGERILPTARYLTPRLIEQRRGQWLRSTPVEVVGDSLAPPALSAGPNAEDALYRDVDDLWETRGFGRAVETVYVAAQPLADGRIEFAIEHNGERVQPDARYLTPQLIRDRQGDWLRSSPVMITAAVAPAELVRAASASAAANSPRRTPVDVAAVCELSDVVLLTSFQSPYGEWASHPHLTHWIWADQSASFLPDGEEIGIRANEERLSSVAEEVPAPSYGFLVQDVRWQAPTVWWVAEFRCGSGSDESGGGNQNLS